MGRALTVLLTSTTCHICFLPVVPSKWELPDLLQKEVKRHKKKLTIFWKARNKKAFLTSFLNLASMMANLPSFGSGVKLPREHEKQSKRLAICHHQKQKNQNVIITSGGIESPPGAESDIWTKNLQEPTGREDTQSGGVGNWAMLLVSNGANLRKAHKGFPAGPTQDRWCRQSSLQCQPGGTGGARGSWRHRWIPRQFSAFQMWRASSQ